MAVIEVNGEQAVAHYRSLRGQQIYATYKQYDLTEELDGRKFMGSISFYESLPTYHTHDAEGNVISLDTEMMFGGLCIKSGWSVESLIVIVSTELRNRLSKAMKDNTRTVELQLAYSKLQEALIALDALTARVADEAEHGAPSDI